MNAEALTALAIATRDAALARDRAAFDAKWGSFWKCASCGEATWDPYPDGLNVARCSHGHRNWIRTGYSRTQ